MIMSAIEAFNIDAVISTEQLRTEISTLSVSRMLQSLSPSNTCKSDRKQNKTKFINNFLFILIGK